MTRETLMPYSNFLQFQRDRFALCPLSLRPLETCPLSRQGVGWSGGFWGSW